MFSILHNNFKLHKCDGGIAPLDPTPFEFSNLLHVVDVVKAWNKPWDKDWNTIYKHYPLHGFILYSDMDEEIAKFVRLKGGWLHALIGYNCLIGVFENASDWGPAWDNFWRKALGKESDQLIEMWRNLQPFDRNHSYRLAEDLGIDKNALPCIVFLESYDSKELFYIPIITADGDKMLYKYFQDIFTAVNYASKARQGQKLKILKIKWIRYGIKWKLYSILKISLLHGSKIVRTTIAIKEILKFSK